MWYVARLIISYLYLRPQFVIKVAYQRILQLTYVNDLLYALKSLFVKFFEPFLTTFVASLHAMTTAKVAAGQVATWNFAKAFDGWDSVFDKVLRGLEDKSAQAGSRTLQRHLV